MLSIRFTELENKLLTITDPKQQIDVRLDLVAEMRLFDNVQALEKAKQILNDAIDENYTAGIARSTYSVGMCYWQLGDYDKAIVTLNDALALAKKNKNKKLEAKCYNILGNIYRDIGEVSSALKYYLNALDIFDKQNDEHTTGVVMKNIGILHFDLFDYDNALDYALRSVNILEKYENKHRIVSVYHTLGNIYFKKEDYTSALSYFYKCVELSEQNTNLHTLATSGLGKVYYMMGKFNKAKNYLHHAFKLGNDANFFESYIVAGFYLGRLELDTNNYAAAIDLFNNAINSAIEHNRKHDVMSVHEWLAIAYEKNGNVYEALQNLKAFEKLKSEIFQTDGVNKVRNMQVQHEIAFAKKDKEVAERTASLKQQFLANMSHEIRTPMNAIVGMSRLLYEREHLPHQKKYLNAIVSSANNLLVIINDILDLTKLEAGKVEIEKIPFNIRQSIQSVQEILRFKAIEKNLEFHIDIENGIQQVLVGDPTRLNQILINLLGNAIKFTEQGHVTLKVVTRKQDDAKTVLRFDVIDSGIGISQDYVNNLFEKFTQAGSDTARKYGGTGLGLSISKQLVDVMNGNISVKSTMGQGTTFTFELPFNIADNQELSTVQTFIISNEHKNILNSLDILLVEDNEFNQILAIDTLKELAPNIQIDVAINGKIAVAKAKEKVYDLILMDIQMPEMNGVQATQQIRSTFMPPYCDVKIVAMTANVMKEDINQYLEAGMNETVSKPFTTEILVHKIISVLGNKVIEPTMVTTPEVVSAEPSFTTPITNLQFLDSFTNGNWAKQQKYIQLYLDNAPNALQKAAEALANKDYETVKINVHSLKSQLNYMGVAEDISNVQATEKACQDANMQDQLPAMLKKLHAVCQQSFAELNQKIADNS
jgi:signal transduction histidine kinase/DNA-binding NarL/FixJ family response regulator/Flp pilus assembly protein TadD/HPt (histidine-containing phosphotransfer) domain-containing protein